MKKIFCASSIFILILIKSTNNISFDLFETRV